jgi:hypothetical protein
MQTQQTQLEQARRASQAYQEAVSLLVEAQLDLVAAEMAATEYPSTSSLETYLQAKQALRWAYDQRRQANLHLVEDLLDPTD